MATGSFYLPYIRHNRPSTFASDLMIEPIQVLFKRLQSSKPLIEISEFAQILFLRDTIPLQS